MKHAINWCLPFALTFVLFGTSQGVLAQHDDDVLEEIVVTATRIPTAFSDTLPTTSIITSDDIERLKPRDFGELLKRKSGINFRDSGGLGSSGDFFVRGTEGSQVLILIDGVRTASATLGTTAIERIPLDSIERIEIIKGPMSGIYGSDAIGGVIQIFTKQAEQDESYGSFQTVIGSNQYRKAHAYGGFGSETSSVHASLTTESTDGIDRTAFKGGGNEDRDGLNRVSGNFSWLMEPNDELSVKIGHVSTAGKVDYDNTSRSSRMTSGRAFVGYGWHQRVRLNTTSVRFDYAQSDVLSFVGILGKTADKRDDFRPDTGANSRFNSEATDISLQTNFIFSPKSQVTIGIDRQKDKVDSTTTYTETERNNSGLFALWQYQGNIFGSVINARRDKNNTYGSISNYSTQQSVRLTESLELVTSYGTAFKAPTLNQLFFPESGNPDLNPEESKSYEVSLRGDHGDVYWQFNAYKTQVENLIEWEFDGTTFSPVNKAIANLKGVEYELSRQWNNNILGVSLGYLDSEDAETGEFLDDRARTSGSFELGRQFDDIFISVDGFLEHSRYDRGGTLPGYTVWGISAEYNLTESLSVTGHIDNVFDKEYITNLAHDDNPYQNEGRTFELKLAYDF